VLVVAMAIAALSRSRDASVSTVHSMNFLKKFHENFLIGTTEKLSKFFVYRIL
jgi:hypothetical protein